MLTEVRLEVSPGWPFRLPRGTGLDFLTRVRGGVLHRLLHIADEPVVVRVAQIAPDRVLFGAQASDSDAAEWGIERMRISLGIDHDLRPFYDRFRFDPLIGRSVRSSPWLRPYGRPDPFEALTWAICEQLIESERAAQIQRRLVARLGRRCGESGLSDAPTAATLAGQAPALLESLGLSAGRAVALIRAAREVAAGRVDLLAPDHERGWARLRTIRGIGTWTVQKLALTGQGRLDQLPAGDLAFVKFVGRRLKGHPYGRASEEQVMEYFAPYGSWAGLAGIHALRSSSAPGAHLPLAA